MPDHTHIYDREADAYHQLISKQPDLSPIVEEIRPFHGLDIVDIGAGTGRLTTVLAPRAKSIVALDASASMLQVTAERLQQARHTNWRTQVADHRKLPLEDQSADLIVAGWTICYVASSNVPNWEQNLRSVMDEMKRVLRPGGTILIFETLGTGTETPAAPDFLQNYYAALVDTYGFAHKWVRTDYQFDTVHQAEELTRFFFGEDLADKVIQHHLVHLPECAGIWWLRI
jgi:ubiquinone/menaquinone biosynthesis C-methylase UbiE